MKEKNTVSVARGVRLTAENHKRLEYASMLGANASKVINEILNDHLKEYVVRLKTSKSKEIMQALEAPVP